MPVLDFFKTFYTIFFVWLAGLAAANSLRKPVSLAFSFFACLIIFITVMETVANIMDKMTGQRCESQQIT